MQFNFIPQPELVVVPKPNPVNVERAVGAVGLLEVGKSMQESVLRERLFANSLAPATPSAGTAAVKAARGWGDSSKSDLEETFGTGGASSVGCAFTGRFSTMDAKLMGGMREVDFRLNSGFSSPLPPPRVFIAVKRTAPTTTSPSNGAPTSATSSSQEAPPPPACLGTIAFELNGEGIFPLANVKNKSAFGLLEIHKAPCIVTSESMKTVNTTHTMRPKAFQPASLFMTTCRDWMSIFTSYDVSSDLHKNDGHVLKDGHYGRHFTVECTYKALDGNYNAPNAWFQDYHCQVLPQVSTSTSNGNTSSRLLHVNSSASERTQMRALADSLETMNKDTQHKRAHIIGAAHIAISAHGLSSEGETKIKDRAAAELATLTEETIRRKDERYEAASKYRSTITYVPIFMAGFTKGDIGVWCPLRGAMLCRLNNSSTRAPPKSRVLNGGGAVTAITCLKGSMQRAVERCTEAMINDFNGLYNGSGSGYASKYADHHNLPHGTGSVSDPASLPSTPGSNGHSGVTAADGGIYAACYTSADVLIFGIDSVTEGCVLRIVGGGVFGNRPLQGLSTGVFPWELNCALHPPFTIWKDRPDGSDMLDEATCPPHVLLSSLKRRKKGHSPGTPILGFNNNADDEGEWPATSYLHKPPEVHNATSSAVVGSGHFTGLLWSQREIFTALITSSEAVSHVFEGAPMIHSDDDPSDWSPSNQGISPRRRSPSRDDSADTFENLSPPPRSESPCVGSGATAVLKRAKRNQANPDSTTNSSTFKNGAGGGKASSQPRPDHIRTAPSYKHSLVILAPTLSAHMLLLRSMHYNNLGFLTTLNGIIYVLSLPTLTPIGAIRMRKFDLHGETLSLCGLANHCPGTAAYQRSKLAVDAHNIDGACAMDPILCGAGTTLSGSSSPSGRNPNNLTLSNTNKSQHSIVSAPVQSMLLSITGERDSIDLVKVDIEIPPASWMGAAATDHVTPQSPTKKTSSKASKTRPATAPTSTHSGVNGGIAQHLQEGTICSAMMNECIIPESIKHGQTLSLSVGASSPCFGGSHSRSTSEVVSLETSNTNVGGGAGMYLDNRQLPFYVLEALRTEASNPLFAWIHSPKLGSAAALFACPEGEFQPVRTTLVKSLSGHNSWVLSTAGFAAPQLHNFAQATYLPISDGPEVLAQHVADITQAANAASSPHNMNARNSFAFNKTVSTGLFNVVNNQQHASMMGRMPSSSSFQIANRSLSTLPTHPNITFGTAIAGMPHYTAVQKCMGETSPMTGIIITSVSMDQRVKVWMVEGCVSVAVRGGQPGGMGGGGLDGTTNRSFGASPSSGTFATPTNAGLSNSNGQVDLSVVQFHVQDDPVYDLPTLDTVLTNEDGRTDHAAKVVATGVDGRCAFLMLAHKGKASLFDVEGYNLGDMSGL